MSCGHIEKKEELLSEFDNVKKNYENKIEEFTKEKENCSCLEEIEKLKDDVSYFKKNLQEEIEELELKLISLGFAREHDGVEPLDFWEQEQTAFAKEMGFQSAKELESEMNWNDKFRFKIYDIMKERGLNDYQCRVLLSQVNRWEFQKSPYEYVESFSNLKK